MGEGQLADQFQPMAAALRVDGYNGVISFKVFITSEMVIVKTALGLA